MCRFILILLLTACASPQEIAQKEINECASLGFKTGTSEFGLCRLELRQIRAQKAAVAINANNLRRR